MVVAIGIDPGLAKVGMALVEGDRAPYQLLDAELIVTEKNDKKNRVTAFADSNERYRQIYDAAGHMLAAFDIDIVGMEGMNYVPGAGKNLIKTAQAVGVMKGLLFSHGRAPLEYSSAEVKRLILGKKSGTKQEIQDWVNHNVKGIPHEHRDWKVKNRCEHLFDAVTLAVCAIEDLKKNRMVYSKSI